MSHSIICGGPKRFERHPDFKARLKQLRASVEARHASELAAASFWGRIALRWRIRTEYRREAKQLAPSRYSL